MAPILITRVGRLRLGSKLKRPMANGDQTIFVLFLFFFFSFLFLVFFLLSIKPVVTNPSLFPSGPNFVWGIPPFSSNKGQRWSRHPLFLLFSFSYLCLIFFKRLVFSFPLCFVSWLFSQFKETHHDWQFNFSWTACSFKDNIFFYLRVYESSTHFLHTYPNHSRAQAVFHGSPLSLFFFSSGYSLTSSSLSRNVMDNALFWADKPACLSFHNGNSETSTIICVFV